MVTNPVLRLFLVLSIMIIMAGILLIIINQFDRGYVFIGQDTEFQSEQKKLIDHVYQSQIKAQEIPLAPLNSPAQKAAIVVPTERSVPTPPQQQPTRLQAPSPQPLAMPQQLQPPAPQQAPVNPVEDVFASNPWERPYQSGYDYQTQLLRNNPWSPYYKPGQ